MSLAQVPHEVYGLPDPCIVQNENRMPAFQSCRQVQYMQRAANNASENNIQWQCPPTEQNVYLDRLMLPKIGVRAKIVISSQTGVQSGVLIIQPHKFCIRDHALLKAIDQINIYMNNNQLSMDIGLIVSALSHFNIDDKLRQVDLSMSASYPCYQSQEFWHLYGSSRSPMALFADAGAGDIPRSQAFSVYASNATTSGTSGTAWVDFVLTQALWISPLYFAAIQNDSAAFMGLSSFRLRLTFSANAAHRMFAIMGYQDDNGSAHASSLFDTEAHARAATVTTTMYVKTSDFPTLSPAFSWQYSDVTQPLLLLRYLEPQPTDKNKERKLFSYPYYDVQYYQTAIGDILPGATQTVTAQNIQLNAVPQNVIVQARMTDSDLRKNPFIPDVCARLTNPYVRWGTIQKFNGAADEHMYVTAVRNGLKDPFIHFNGSKINKQPIAGAVFGDNTDDNSYYAGSGTVYNFSAMDVGLAAEDAPGKSKEMSLLVKVDVNNISQQTVNYDLFVIVVTPGVVTIGNGVCYAEVGVLSGPDVYNASQPARQNLTYSEARDLYGGNCFCDLKENVSRMLKSKKGGPAADQASGFGAGNASPKDLEARLMKAL